MDKSVLDITDSVRCQKQVLTTSDVRDIEVTFVVKLRVHNIDTHFSVHNYFFPWLATTATCRPLIIALYYCTMEYLMPR